MYQKPDVRALSVVKEEKVERSVFRKKLKEAKAAGMKKTLEDIAFFDNDGNDMNIDFAMDAGLEEEYGTTREGGEVDDEERDIYGNGEPEEERYN